MDVVQLRHQPPDLRSPIMVAAFQGWNDAGEAASGAVAHLRRQLRARSFAAVDPEEFFDFQATRPMVRLDEQGVRRITWPRNRFSWAALPGSQRDIVLLEGTEPNLRWRTFARGVAGFARRLGVDTVVTLGALQVDAPHTRPVMVTGTAADPELASRMGLRPSRYEGPTGMTGVLTHTCATAGMQTLSLWAGVPHYLAATQYLAGSLALAERVISAFEADLSLDRLAREAAEQRDDIAELVAEDDDLAEYVAELEERVAVTAHDDERRGMGAELPSHHVSGEEIAEEVERFLRERSDG